MAPPDEHDVKRIEVVLAHSIWLLERIHSAADNAESFRSECANLRNLLDRLWPLLCSLARFIAATPSIYDRPIRRVLSETIKNLDRALAIARKCRRRGVIHRLLTITNAADFRKVLRLLEASVADLTWLLRVYGVEGGDGGGIELSLPPIAANDPILSWIWSFIASIHTRTISDKTKAAIELASLADVSERNKKLIAEEGGVSSLVKLLKEPETEARIAATAALHNLADDQERVTLIVNSHGLPVIIQALSECSTKVQIPAAMLVARMAEHDPAAREGFARENAVRPLVNLLSPEIKILSAAKAIWVLARGSVANCRRITETKNGLLYLAKMVEVETGELQFCSLMALMEVTAAAEVNVDLRQTAFKTNVVPAKAVVDQLLRLINGSHGPDLKIPAIRSIGSLSRTFPARETRIIVSLMCQLGSHADVAAEAAISLSKFVCPQNFLHAEHSKTIIELNGVTKVMRLLRGNETTQFYGLVLLCYLALHAGPSKERLERARVLTTLEGADRSVAAHHPELMELVLKARYHLKTFAVNWQCYGVQGIP